MQPPRVTCDDDVDAATVCLACANGEEWDATGGPNGISTCTGCSLGQADSDSDSLTACETCVAGFYGDGFTCEQCSLTGWYDSDSDPATPCTINNICYQTCSPGTEDHDCDTSTPCAACADGLGICPSCAAGTVDEDNSAVTPCTNCNAGFFSTFGSAGTCAACPHGQYAGLSTPNECDDCAAGKADKVRPCWPSSECHVYTGAQY
jgi:hypothetical protein